MASMVLEGAVLGRLMRHKCDKHPLDSEQLRARSPRKSTVKERRRTHVNFGLDSRPKAECYRLDDRPVLQADGTPHSAMDSQSEQRLAAIAAAIYENAWRLNNAQLSVLVEYVRMHQR